MNLWTSGFEVEVWTALLQGDLSDYQADSYFAKPYVTTHSALWRLRPMPTSVLTEKLISRLDTLD